MNQTNEALVSVIIPIYNRQNLIKQTIQSVLDQTTNHPIEIIVIDDGSTDSSYNIVSEIKDERIPIRLFKQKNMGVSAARNRGIIESNGAYIQFLDSDDIIAPDKFKLQISKFENNPKAELCTSSAAHFHNSIHNIQKKFQGSNVSHENILPAFINSCQWPIHAPLYRKSAIKEIGNWNEQLTCLEDWEYGCRAGTSQLHVVYCKQILAFIREHDAERLSKGDLIKTSHSMRIAVHSIVNHLERIEPPLEWYNILSSQMVSAARGFISSNQLNHANECLLDAIDITHSKPRKLFIYSYIGISKVIGYKRFLQVSRLLAGWLK